MKKLPNKPSALIRVALVDIEKADKLKDVVVDMGVYHSREFPYGTDPRPCRVCFAGATLLGSAESMDGHADLMPGDFDERTEAKLKALDCFRTGAAWHALCEMGIVSPLRQNRYHIVPYGQSPSSFKRDMNKMIARLERVGL